MKTVKRQCGYTVAEGNTQVGMHGRVVVGAVGVRVHNVFETVFCPFYYSFPKHVDLDEDFAVRVFDFGEDAPLAVARQFIVPRLVFEGNCDGSLWWEHRGFHHSIRERGCAEGFALHG